jgi:integration host factor subunit alpha
LGRRGIADGIREQTGLSRASAAELVEEMLEHMRTALCAGERVKITRFGVFDAYERPPGVGCNPETGEEYPVPSIRTLRFRMSRHVRQNVVSSRDRPADQK